MLDCLEYLIIHNGFEHVFKMIELINEFVMQRKASLIVPVSPETLEPKQISLLERGLEVVEAEKVKALTVDERLVALMEKY